MKNLLFSIIAIVLFSFVGNAQDMYTEDTAVESASRITCKRFGAGINILAAWVETDIYIACGFPYGSGIGGGSCLVVSQKYCAMFDDKTTPPSKYLNLRNIFPNTDTSNITEAEITSSTIFTEEDGVQYTLQLGKYPVDKDGNFEVLMIEVRK